LELKIKLELKATTTTYALKSIAIGFSHGDSQVSGHVSWLSNLFASGTLTKLFTSFNRFIQHLQEGFLKLNK
jgi:hypothetical protein